MPAPLRRAATATLSLGVLAAGWLACAPASVAHDQLIASTPAAGDQFDTPPGEVVLTMSGDALEIGTTVLVSDLDGENYAGEVTISGPDVTVALGDLVDGFYDVRWRIVSSDGHPVSGVIPFSVGDVGDRPTAQADSGEAPTSGEGSDGTTTTGPTDHAQTETETETETYQTDQTDQTDAAAVQAAADSPPPPVARTLVVAGGGALAGVGVLALFLAARRIRDRRTT